MKQYKYLIFVGLVIVSGIVYSCQEKESAVIIKNTAQTEAVETQNGNNETETTRYPLSETVEQIQSAKKDEQSNDKVDINKATQEELMCLTGIGQTRAQKIIEYRNQNGAFNTIEDIMNVTGIKDGIFNKIKDQITVGR